MDAPCGCGTVALAASISQSPIRIGGADQSGLYSLFIGQSRFPIWRCWVCGGWAGPRPQDCQDESKEAVNKAKANALWRKIENARTLVELAVILGEPDKIEPGPSSENGGHETLAQWLDVDGIALDVYFSKNGPPQITWRKSVSGS